MNQTKSTEISKIFFRLIKTNNYFNHPTIFYFHASILTKQIAYLNPLIVYDLENKFLPKTNASINFSLLKTLTSFSDPLKRVLNISENSSANSFINTLR